MDEMEADFKVELVSLPDADALEVTLDSTSSDLEEMEAAHDTDMGEMETDLKVQEAKSNKKNKKNKKKNKKKKKSSSSNDMGEMEADFKVEASRRALRAVN